MDESEGAISLPRVWPPLRFPFQFRPGFASTGSVKLLSAFSVFLFHMADPLPFVPYLAGLIGVIAGILFVYVYRTATDLEVQFVRMRQRAEGLVHDMDSIQSNVDHLRAQAKGKASYHEAEQLLASATGRIMLKDKQVALGDVNSKIRVELK